VQVHSAVPPSKTLTVALTDAVGASNCGTCCSSMQNLEGWCTFETSSDGQVRTIKSNGIPRHDYDIYASGHHANANPICEDMKMVTLPVHAGYPTKEEAQPRSYKPTPMGPVGYLTTCGYLYNHLSNPHGAMDVAAQLEEETMDNCNGHADMNCHYHYHSAPKCVVGFDETNPGLVIGYLFDGYEVRGYSQCGNRRCMSCYIQISGSSGNHTSDYVFDASAYSTGGCDLDKANGHTVHEDGLWKYVYVITENFPFIIPGYMGMTFAELEDYNGPYMDGDAAGEFSQCSITEVSSSGCAFVSSQQQPIYNGLKASHSTTLEIHPGSTSSTESIYINCSLPEVARLRIGVKALLEYPECAGQCMCGNYGQFG
jgi:hypothetical protein